MKIKKALSTSIITICLLSGLFQPANASIGGVVDSTASFSANAIYYTVKYAGKFVIGTVKTAYRGVKVFSKEMVTLYKKDTSPKNKHLNTNSNNLVKPVSNNSSSYKNQPYYDESLPKLPELK